MTLLFSFGDFGAIVLIVLGIIVFRFILTLFYGGVSKITGKTISHRGDTWAKPYNETDKLIKVNEILPELPKITEYLSKEEKERRQGLILPHLCKGIKDKLI
jgi:hypothetical protein